MRSVGGVATARVAKLMLRSVVEEGGKKGWRRRYEGEILIQDL
jgi:hypothetical protein